MKRTLTCSNGHTWDLAVPGAAPAGTARGVCPMCGQPGRPTESLGEQTEAASLNLSATLEQTLPTPIPSPVSHASSLSSRASRADDRSGTLRAAATSGPQSAGTYSIIRLHAAGGLGCVNLARDEAIGREVALKQIQPHLADNPHSRQRFVTEAKITGRLEHPGIVPVYAMGTDATGHAYYVMKFIRGRTLDEVITEHLASPNPLVFRELLRRFVAICQTIAYAHSRGIIHRDIKPQNIMLGDYGETLVLDWGLAKDMKDKSAAGKGNAESSVISAAARPAADSALQTLDGQVIGTPAYMAPEQAAGRTDLHGPATDIYSLGAVLYKLLTGHPPNTGKSTGNADLSGYQPPPRPSSVVAGVPPALEAICMKAMAGLPEQRYQRAMELAEAVQRFLDDTPLRTQAPSLAARFTAWLRQNPIVAIFWALLLLAGVLAVVGLAVWQHK